MQYFVTLEDSKDFRWQGELLYESIKLLDLQEHFVVAICPGKGNAVRKPPYPNVIYFDNVGRKMGFPRFNKCYGLGKAIEAGKLKQPFVVLDADMFLLHAILPIEAPVAAQRYKKYAWENVRDELEGVTIGTRWTDIGGVYQFNGVPSRVFEDIIRYTHDMYHRLGNRSDIHNYGFIMGIMNNEVPVNKQSDFEMPLMYDKNADVSWNSHIVHYRDGYPPYFRKEGAFDTINFSFNVPLPMKAVLDAPTKHQPNVAIMQTLIRSWVESNLTRLWELL